MDMHIRRRWQLQNSDIFQLHLPLVIVKRCLQKLMGPNAGAGTLNVIYASRKKLDVDARGKYSRILFYYVQVLNARNLKRGEREVELCENNDNRVRSNFSLVARDWDRTQARLAKSVLVKDETCQDSSAGSLNA